MRSAREESASCSGVGAVQNNEACTLVESGPGKWQLDLRGQFPPGWLGRLADGLAGHRIGVVSGHARRSGGARWCASFEILATSMAVDPTGIDMMALLQGGTCNRSVEDLLLEDFTVAQAIGGGAVEVRVRGGDQVGFLGRVLKVFALFSLFPVEMEVDTVGGLADDRFLLKGIAGIAPSPAATEALRERFTACCPAA